MNKNWKKSGSKHKSHRIEYNIFVISQKCQEVFARKCLFTHCFCTIAALSNVAIPTTGGTGTNSERKETFA